MNLLLTSVIVIQVVSALVIIGLVLLQHGKGADMGAAFGSGASGSLFGATGSSNFLSKSTAVAAVVFFCATLALAYIGSKRPAAEGGKMENLPTTTAPASVPKTATPPAAAPASSAPANSAPAPAQTPANQIPK